MNDARATDRHALRYLDVCSGISAPTQAWARLGWQCAGYAEIEAFPRAVLQHRYGAAPVANGAVYREIAAPTGAPLFGDFTTIEADDVGAIDLLVGGTPCQSFSLAGLRGGLGDDRGNLALEFLRLAQRTCPRWLVWENVPGVLSSGGGRDFGAILAGMVQCGYGLAYRVLDAQYVRVQRFWRAVPQRRRRVFVVGHFGSWQRAAAVLFEREGLRRHSPPGRQAQEIAAALTSNGVGTCGADDNQAQANRLVAHALRGEGFDASEDGTGRGTPLVASSLTAGMAASASRLPSEQGALVAFDCKGSQVQHQTDGGHPPLRSMGHHDSHANAGGHAAVAIQERAVAENPDHGPDGKGWRDDGAAYTMEARTRPQAVAYDLRGRDGGAQMEGPHETANIRAGGGGSSRSYVGQAPIYKVRRLTPRECERLQGFPDDFTQIPWRGKAPENCPDGPRYKALGNSMAVNVMTWIGERIQQVEGLDA